jgi:hypothetical protein
MRYARALPFLASVLSFAFTSTLSANAQQCGATAPPCSYTLLNSNCTVTIDRKHPVTPPTIYVKPACTVTVVATDSYQFEKLTLDWKSTTAAVPPDTFQSAFTSLSATLGKVTVIGGINHFAAVTCEDTPGVCTDAVDISKAQRRVSDNVDAADPLGKQTVQDALDEFKHSLEPPPGGPAASSQPWSNTSTWKTATAGIFTAAIPTDVAMQKFLQEQINLDGDIDVLKAAAANPIDKAKVATLLANQAILKTKIDAVNSASLKLTELATGISGLVLQPAGIIGNSTISDLTPNDPNYQTQTWALDYTNIVQPLAKRIAADSLKSKGTALLGSIADPSPKLPVITITVQFQKPNRIEISSGLMVPLMPYHSYSKASVASGGIVTDNVVQETKTFTVVPMAFVNVLVHEWITNQQRSAWFFSPGVGYNPTTSSVEFGAGITYSYRSVAFSALADIGRDTKLGGGFVVGQSLGNTSSAATPITSTYWTVKPALALSVRIPLGGGAASK